MPHVKSTKDKIYVSSEFSGRCPTFLENTGGLRKDSLPHEANLTNTFEAKY